MMYCNTILLLLLASLRVKEVNAVYVEGMLRLFRGEGNYDDSTGISSALTTHRRRNSPNAGITFVSDIPYGSKTRSVFNFDGNGRARGIVEGLPGGAAPRTMVGWYKTTGVIPRGYYELNGAFGYGKLTCRNAFYVWIKGDSGEKVNLDYFCVYATPPPFTNSALNEWYHVAFIWDGTNNIAYVDGVKIKTWKPDSVPDTVVDSSRGGTFAIGGNPNSEDEGGIYIGRVADVAIFDRVLSGTEVLTIYNDPNGLEGPQPTTVPTVQPTLAPTLAPSSTPTSIPTSAPTMPPTLARTFEWTIERDDNGTVVEVPSGNVTYPVVTIPYNISDRVYEVTIFQNDCKSELQNNEFLLESSDVVYTGDGFKSIEVKVMINNVTALQMSDMFNSSSTSANICVRTGLHYNNTIIAETEVSFLETVMTFAIDLTVEVPSFSVGLDRIEAETDEAVVSYDEYITAFLCDENGEEDTSGIPFSQNDAMMVCVKSTEVDIDGFNFVHLYQGGEKKFSAINDGLPSILTEIKRINSTYQTKVQLLALFFKEDNPANVNAVGEVRLNFSNGRRLAVTLPLSSVLQGDHGEKIHRNVQDDKEEKTSAFNVNAVLEKSGPDMNVDSGGVPIAQLASSLLLFLGGILIIFAA